MANEPSPAAERKFEEMILKLCRSVRKGNDPELARVAADWEIELSARLSPPLRLVAEPPPDQASGTGGKA